MWTVEGEEFVFDWHTNEATMRPVMSLAKGEFLNHHILPFIFQSTSLFALCAAAPTAYQNSTWRHPGSLHAQDLPLCTCHCTCPLN